MKHFLTIFSYIALVPIVEGEYEYLPEEINTSFIEVTGFNQRERDLLYALHIASEAIFLNDVTNQAALPVEMYVHNKQLLHRVEKLLIINDMQFTMVPNDKPIRSSENDEYELPDRFFMYDEVLSWVDKQVKNQRNIERKFLTETYEKRGIFVLRVLAQPSRGIKVMLVGGEQGRDWMSPAVLLNYANMLLEETIYKPLTDKFDFFIMPVMNPDGYQYSMSNSRFWVKNRKIIFPEKRCSNRTAIGINVERNMFDSNVVPFNSDSECGNVFAGHKAISEEETRSLRFVLSKIAGKMLLFVNVRGFERLITIPYADKSKRCRNHDVLMEILSAVSIKLYKKFNISYFYGSTSSFLYNLTGNCADWVKRESNVPVVLTVYLKDDATYLPEVSQVAPLTEQFATIINETLSLAYEIYKPLYKNHQVSEKGNLTVIFILFVLSFII